MDKELKILKEERKKREEATEAFRKEIQEVCGKHKSLGFGSSRAISDIMLFFDEGKEGAYDYEIGNYAVESVMDTYLARKIESHIPRLERLYQHLVDNKYTEKNQWEYTGDGYAFYLQLNKKDKRRIFCIGRRSANYLIFLEGAVEPKVSVDENLSEEQKEVLELMNKLVGRKTLHIRQVFDSYKDHWFSEEFEFDDGGSGMGMFYALTHTSTLNEISDNVDNYRYVRRPDLAWYKKRKFELEYSDCRDGGYVLTFGGLMYNDRLDRCLGNYYEIKNAFFWVQCGVNAMFEEE